MDYQATVTIVAAPCAVIYPWDMITGYMRLEAAARRWFFYWFREVWFFVQGFDTDVFSGARDNHWDWFHSALGPLPSRG